MGKSIARSLLPAVGDDKFPLVQFLVHLVLFDVFTKHYVAETGTGRKRRCRKELDPVTVLIAMNKSKGFNGIDDDLLDDIEEIAETCICNEKTHRSQARQIAEKWLATAKELEEEKATKAFRQPKREYTDEECKYAADECKDAVDECEYSDNEDEGECTDDDEEDECEYTDGNESDADDDADYWAIV